MEKSNQPTLSGSIVKQNAHEAQKDRTRNNWVLQQAQDKDKQPDKSSVSKFNYDDEEIWLNHSLSTGK